MPRAQRLPKLPGLLDRKIYKTGQTRGADDDEIYQNRVSRNSTILIPYSQFDKFMSDEQYHMEFEKGYIVLISPKDYFENVSSDELSEKNLRLGENLLIFYEIREDWNNHNPDVLGYSVASSRESPLGGQYIARIPATTSLENGGKISKGFNVTSLKGAGIRAYEYASTEIIQNVRTQLEAIYWLCFDSIEIATQNGMTREDAETRKSAILEKARELNLLDTAEMKRMRIINNNGITICPLGLEQVSANGFFDKVAQADGREVVDLTVTQLSLFHIEELRYGLFNHRPYNLGWGHHFCNVVAKDSGIYPTIDWMQEVIDRNVNEGYIPERT